MNPFLIILLLYALNVHTFIIQPQLNPQRQQLNEPTTEQNTALLVTNPDTISLIYPKEMGYENDYLHIIFKLNCSANSYRIEDSVFDNKTWSIYFILSNLTGGSDLVRLRRINKPSILNTASSTTSNMLSNEYSFQIASNWVFNLVNQNNTAKMLSLDINIHRRKLYWFEFNKYNQIYSIAIMRLSNTIQSGKKLHYVMLERPSIKFSQDGYSYIAVVKDNDIYNTNNDITIFISNNETLVICYLVNMTCIDYLRHVNPNNQALSTVAADLPPNSEGDYSYEDELTTKQTTTTLATSTVYSEHTSASAEPLINYGKLMGIKYDPYENNMIVCDYLGDQIDRIHFSDSENFKPSSVETLLKLEYITKLSKQQDNLKMITMNPIMSVLNENCLFWIDYDEGLKVNHFKTPIMRTLYKIKEPVSLKLVFVTTPRLVHISQITNTNSSNKNLISLLKNINNKYRYPPDYIYYLKYLKEQEEELSNAVVVGSKSATFRYSQSKLSSSARMKSKLDIIFSYFFVVLFLLVVEFFLSNPIL